jgi:hypothetical protein
LFVSVHFQGKKPFLTALSRVFRTVPMKKNDWFGYIGLLGFVYFQNKTKIYLAPVAYATLYSEVQEN